MAIKVNILVGNITSTISAGYTHVKVYRSAKQTDGFVEITTPSSRVPLEVGVSNYEFIDGSGTTEHWYQISFYDPSESVAETVPSAAFQEDFYDTNFSPITYPDEAVFTPNDRYILDRIRSLIGDPKQLTRDYVSVDTGYSSISLDKTTHTLSNPNGWPLRITLDGLEYTEKTEPRTNDYQFITFSGTQVSTVSGTLDIWYYHFRNSDTEVLRVFNGLTPPPELTADQVPFELALVCAGIELLEAEVRLFGVTSGSEIEIFQEIRINPKGGLTGRLADLKALNARKKDLLDRVLADLGGVNIDIYGTLID